jgi:hypothetical protein
MPLGLMLLSRRKNKEAFQYIKRAAETPEDDDFDPPDVSLSDVRHIFGILLAYGHGCERDEKLARRWLLRSGKYNSRCSKVDEELQFAAEILAFEKAIKQRDTEGLTIDERKERYIIETKLASTSQEDQTCKHLFGCANCVDAASQRRCGRCETVEYCDRHCQRQQSALESTQEDLSYHTIPNQTSSGTT